MNHEFGPDCAICHSPTRRHYEDFEYEGITVKDVWEAHCTNEECQHTWLPGISESRIDLEIKQGLIKQRNKLALDMDKLIVALNKIANHKQTSVDKVYLIHQCEGYQTVAREALANHQKENT